MGKHQGSSTVTSTPDPATQARIQQLWSAGQGAAGTPLPGVDPLTQQAASGFGGAAAAGNLGSAAIAGDPSAFGRFMNPYQQNVIDSYLANQGHSTGLAMNGLNSDATMNGAFGGSRLDVARGTAAADIARDTNSNIANLEQGGFNTAMGNAFNAANLGMAANGQLAGLGDYYRQVAMQNNPVLRQYQTQLQMMGVMPQGQTQTQTQRPGSNPLNGAIGGASIGSMFGPIGMGIGGALGGLAGLFG